MELSCRAAVDTTAKFPQRQSESHSTTSTSTDVSAGIAIVISKFGKF